ncbi:glycoprotein [Parry Creek virus]|uniref:Glycoprotein n=1 Tax=Parry Creek virus TaxID=318845 RepID=A0A0D3R112_9RHAB|nr:glycoprotein [Parry Creek virus]AJR28318.1 glycoprotein [Parry Creek virus]
MSNNKMFKPMIIFALILCLIINVSSYIYSGSVGGYRPKKVRTYGEVIPYTEIVEHRNLYQNWNGKHRTGHRTVLPTHCHTEWKDVTHGSIKCPHRKVIGTDGIYNTYIGDVWHPHTDSGSEIKGFLCQKTRWVSTCIETWYFSTTKETKIEEVVINPEDCLASITLMDSGEYIEPFFPPHVCSWAATNENAKEFVTVHSHPVVVDIYKNEMIDPIFLSGKCKEKVCHTIHKNVIWIEANDNERSDICVASAWESSHVFADLDIEPDIRAQKVEYIGESIDSEIYGPRSLKGACLIKICGIWGIRFSHGEWWGLKTLSNKISFADGLYNCGSNTSVGFIHNIWTPSGLIGEITYRDHKCLDVVSSLLGHQKINPYELSYLIQDFPGEGPAYRIMKQMTGLNRTKSSFKMQMKTCRYHTAYITNVTFQPIDSTQEVYKLGIWGSGHRIILNSTEIGINPTYTNSGSDWELLLTFNGLMRFGSELVLPHAVFSDHPNTSDLLEDYEINLIGHPKEIFQSDQDELAQIYKFYRRANSTNVVSLASNFLKDIGKSIGNFFGGTKNLIWWIVTLALSTLGTFIAYKLGLFKCLKRMILETDNESGNKRISNVYEEPLQLGERGHKPVKNPFFDHGI